jgi:hypothetical protein
VKSLPFWVSAAGGVLLAVSSVENLPATAAVGAVLFLAGLVGFFVVATRRSRAEGIGMLASLARGARDALRIAWHLMP